MCPVVSSQEQPSTIRRRLRAWHGRGGGLSGAALLAPLVLAAFLSAQPGRHRRRSRSTCSGEASAPAMASSPFRRGWPPTPRAPRMCPTRETTGSRSSTPRACSSPSGEPPSILERRSRHRGRRVQPPGRRRHRLRGQRLRRRHRQQPDPEVQLLGRLPHQVGSLGHRQRPVHPSAGHRHGFLGQRLRRRHRQQPDPEVQLLGHVHHQVGKRGHRGRPVQPLRPGSPSTPPATSTSPTRATTGSRSSTPRAPSSPSGEAWAPGTASSAPVPRWMWPRAPHDNVIVADTGNNRIQKFRPSGTFITKWGSLGTGTGQFNGPSGVAVASTDHVYVVDRGNNRIQKFHETDTITPDTTIDSGPSGLTNDASAELHLLVHGIAAADSRLRVQPGRRGVGELRLPQGLLEPLRGRPHLPGEGGGRRRKPRSEPRLPQLHGRRHAPQTTIDSGPSGPDQRRDPDLRLLLRGRGRASSAASTPTHSRPDSRPCSSPHPYERPGRRLPHLRGPGGRRGRQPGPEPRLAGLHGRHRRPRDPRSTPAPPGLTNDPTPTFTFSSSEAGSSFECRFDSSHEADFAALQLAAAPTARCRRLPHLRGPGHRPGRQHRPKPRLRRASRSTPSPPETRSTPAPPGPTNDATPTFGFSSEPGSSFECRFDSDPFEAMLRAPAAHRQPCSSLADGSHTFEVRAIDPAGNPDPSPASRSFTVDTVAPETTIDSGPSGVDQRPDPDLHLLLLGGGLELPVQGRLGRLCEPAARRRPPSHLADGSHTFYVRATDPAGNTDPTPASRSFTVRTAAVNVSGSTLVVTAAAGAKDNFEITRPSASILRVTDSPSGAYTGSGVHAWAGCTRSGDYTANCSAAGITLIQVASGVRSTRWSTRPRSRARSTAGRRTTC